MTKSASNDGEKAVYVKPQLRVVELAAREVLGEGCKMESGGSNSGAIPPCTSGACTGVDIS